MPARPPRRAPMTDQILWLVARGAGMVSLVLFTAVVCLGVLTVVRWQSPSWPRFLSVGLHRNLALLSVVFLVLHIVTAIVDPYSSLGLVAATIPFASSYRPLWVGFGVIAVDLLLALVVSSLLRARLGQRAWRAIHWLAYAAWRSAARRRPGATQRPPGSAGSPAVGPRSARHRRHSRGQRPPGARRGELSGGSQVALCRRAPRRRCGRAGQRRRGRAAQRQGSCPIGGPPASRAR